MSYFEFVIADQLKISASVAAIAARALIGLEAALGLLLLLNTFGYKRWVVKLSVVLLCVFSAHLVYLLLTVGNDVNCGCMGSIAPMSPALSLLKNIGMLLICWILLRRHKPTDAAWLQWTTLPVAISIIILPFVLYPLGRQLQMPFSLLYQKEMAVSPPKMELRKGKHIVCFMSLGCGHCRDAATILSEMKAKNQQMPIHISLATNEDDTLRLQRFDDFLQETKAENLTFQFLYKKAFMEMIKASESNGVPVILWMQDTTVVRKLNVHELNLKEAERWLNN